MKFKCSHCGHVFEGREPFCSKCGAKMTYEDEEKPISKAELVSSEKPVEERQELSKEESEIVNRVGGYEHGVSSHRNSKTASGVILCAFGFGISMFLILGLTILGVYFKRNSSSYVDSQGSIYSILVLFTAVAGFVLSIVSLPRKGIKPLSILGVVFNAVIMCIFTIGITSRFSDLCIFCAYGLGFPFGVVL